jgi:hypothetical protein
VAQVDNGLERILRAMVRRGVINMHVVIVIFVVLVATIIIISLKERSKEEEVVVVRYPPSLLNLNLTFITSP